MRVVFLAPPLLTAVFCPRRGGGGAPILYFFESLF